LYLVLNAAFELFELVNHLLLAIDTFLDHFEELVECFFVVGLGFGSESFETLPQFIVDMLTLFLDAALDLVLEEQQPILDEQYLRIHAHSQILHRSLPRVRVELAAHTLDDLLHAVLVIVLTLLLPRQTFLQFHQPARNRVLRRHLTTQTTLFFGRLLLTLDLSRQTLKILLQEFQLYFVLAHFWFPSECGVVHHNDYILIFNVHT
jgi:hypothetical protein